MAGECCDKRLAASWLVNTLDQAKLFQFFYGSIYRNQSNLWISFPAALENGVSVEHEFACGDDLDNQAAWVSYSIPILIQAFQPCGS